MFILSPSTIFNPAVLETRTVPRRIFGRVTVFPRRGVSPGLVARMIFQMELLRYLTALLPFAGAALIWRDSALAISQAPLLMFLVLYYVETRVLRVPPARRAAVIPDGDAERGLDLLRVRAVAILTRIAAGRGWTAGALHLVVEQSDLARVSPLTLVSVQSDIGPEVIDLSGDEERLIRDVLFRAPLDERQLHRINLSQDECLRDVALELRSISAHARLSAMLG